MKTNKDFSAHSAKGLGAVVAHAVVAHASQHGNQRNVTLGKATGRRALLGNGVTYYNVTLGSVTYLRAAMMLLMMLLTTATAWAEDVPAVYALTFDGNGGTCGDGQMNDQTFTYDESQNLTANAFSRTDYTFAGWNTDADGNGTSYKNGESVKNLTYTDGGTVKLYTQWTPTNYTITYYLNGGSVATANPTSYNIETPTFTLTNPTKEGCHFIGWTEGNGTTPQTTVTITQGSTGNLDFTAHYKANNFTVGDLSYQWTSGTDVKVTACNSSATSVTIPATVSNEDVTYSVNAIDATAFSSCTSLVFVFLDSETPPALGTNAFSACTALNTIVVPTGKAETYKADWPDYAEKIYAIDGTCGNNVYYSYDSTSKTLNIFGTGAMANYSILNQWDIPWYDYRTDITTVVIADGVTSIGDYVFFDCTSLASITIPASVTSIGSAAFSNCNGLASIEIPIRVTSIGSSAFASCASLTSVTIPASVTSIGSSAFIGCTSLTSIEIPASVTSFGGGAFKDCTSLTSIEIPASVTSIGNEVLSYCTSLASISVAAGNTKYDSRNNCNAIIETETNTLIAGCKNTVIPDGTDGVTSIGDYAFWGCTDLTTITIPASVTSIGAGAFERCTSLTSIEIPTSVTSMGAGAFTGCTSLTSFKIPASVTSIGNYAFGDCTSLESITIPDGVTGIGENAFYDCTSLTSIEIPASVTSIGGGAFWCCTSLTSIEIPASVTSLGGGAFKDCTSLNSITIYAPELDYYGYNAFDVNGEGRKIYVFKNCLGTYKAQASRMGVDENDIQAITGINLRDNDDNRSLIAAADGNASGALNVTLQGRTLYKDGDWNTLCLPFDVSTATGTLSGDNVLAMVLRQSDSGLEGTTLTLNFDNAPATIPAGTPFIIRWGTPQTNPGTTLTDPVFTGVTIDNSNDAIARKTQTSTDGTVSFKGTYAKQEYTEENKSILFLGAGNNLYYPQPSDGKLPTIGAFRAYFELTGSTEARQFVLNFGEEETQGIKPPNPLKGEHLSTPPSGGRGGLLHPRRREARRPANEEGPVHPRR